MEQETEKYKTGIDGASAVNYLVFHCVVVFFHFFFFSFFVSFVIWLVVFFFIERFSALCKFVMSEEKERSSFKRTSIHFLNSMPKKQYMESTRKAKEKSNAHTCNRTRAEEEYHKCICEQRISSSILTYLCVFV